MNPRTPFLLLASVLMFSFSITAQPISYLVQRSQKVIKVDGKADRSWKQAAWSAPFVDIEGSAKPVPLYNTRVKMLYDENFLYILAELEEPKLWATLEKRDAIIFHDNDFEVFIDPNNDAQQYFEYEINALGTIMDLFMIRPYKRGGRADLKWNSDGLKSAVALDGTLNDNSDTDKGWTVELAIPFADLQRPSRAHQPKPGDEWRINFSRVQWLVEKDGITYKKQKGANGKNLPEHNWVWSPQGVIDMHVPERWGVIRFE
jgi:hypothetical protein